MKEVTTLSYHFGALVGTSCQHNGIGTKSMEYFLTDVYYIPKQMNEIKGRFCN